MTCIVLCLTLHFSFLANLSPVQDAFPLLNNSHSVNEGEPDASSVCSQRNVATQKSVQMICWEGFSPPWNTGTLHWFTAPAAAAQHTHHCQMLHLLNQIRWREHLLDTFITQSDTDLDLISALRIIAVEMGWKLLLCSMVLNSSWIRWHCEMISSIPGFTAN